MANNSGFFLMSDSLSASLDLLANVGDNSLEGLDSIVTSMLQDAKDNAPWSDRTGAAREQLQADVTQEGDEVVVTLAHGVEYGQWLETIQSGRFAIIMPTLEKYAAEIHKAVAGSIFSGGD